MKVPLLFVCFVLTHFKEIIDIFPHLKGNFVDGTFWMPLKPDFFKVCVIMTLFRASIGILDLMTLISFQGHSYVRNIKCTLLFLIHFFLF